MEKIYERGGEKDLKEVVKNNPALEGLEYQGFRSDREKSLMDLEGFEPLAWTPRVRYLLYNEEKDLLVRDIEGDLYIWKNPTDEKIEELVQEYPKMEVSLGEKYDSRFERGKSDAEKFSGGDK